MCALCSSHDVKKLCQSCLNVSGVSVHGAFSWCHWNFSPTDSEGQLCPYVCMLHAPHVPSVHCMFFCSFYSLLLPFLVISGGGGCGAQGEVAAENSPEVRARARGPGGAARQTAGLGPTVNPGHRRRGAPHPRGRGWARSGAGAGWGSGGRVGSRAPGVGQGGGEGG
jgi:hypothetical protein